MLTLSPNFGFVVEDDLGVCGYVVMALDAKELAKKSRMGWYPAMCEKYPIPEKKESPSPAEVILFIYLFPYILLLLKYTT